GDEADGLAFRELGILEVGHGRWTDQAHLQRPTAGNAGYPMIRLIGRHRSIMHHGSPPSNLLAVLDAGAMAGRNPSDFRLREDDHDDDDHDDPTSRQSLGAAEVSDHLVLEILLE
ncbi:MAG: hypothetical protein ABUL53_01115, partial [Bradyrhizobium guangdongense]